MPRRRQHAHVKKSVVPPFDQPTADEKRESVEDALGVPRGYLKREYRLARAIRSALKRKEGTHALVRQLCELRGCPMGDAFEGERGWRTVAEVLGEMARLDRSDDAS